MEAGDVLFFLGSAVAHGAVRWERRVAECDAAAVSSAARCVVGPAVGSTSLMRRLPTTV